MHYLLCLKSEVVWGQVQRVDACRRKHGQHMLVKDASPLRFALPYTCPLLPLPFCPSLPTLLLSYNFLLYLPCQLEALLQFSLLLCFDAFLVRQACSRQGWRLGV